MKKNKAAGLFIKAYQHNWDDGVTALEKILSNKNCDLATALLIYWHGTPAYYNKYASEKEVPKGELTVYKLIKKIEKSVLKGKYPAKISFEPPADRVPKKLGNIPKIMSLPTEGEESAFEIINGDQNENLFFDALCEGDLAVVKDMIENKGFTAEGKVRGYAPIEVTCSRGHSEQLDYLVKEGANWKKKYDRNTLIHKASTPGGMRVLEQLLELGLKIDAKGEFGRTALHGAAFHSEESWKAMGRDEVVKRLGELGADPYAKDTDKLTPIDLANRAGNALAAEVMESWNS